jgi:hypothetical protein
MLKEQSPQALGVIRAEKTTKNKLFKTQGKIDLMRGKGLSINYPQNSQRQT